MLEKKWFKFSLYRLSGTVASVTQIKTFELMNNVSVYVFSLDSKNVVFPIGIGI